MQSRFKTHTEYFGLSIYLYSVNTCGINVNCLLMSMLIMDLLAVLSVSVAEFTLFDIFLCTGEGTLKFSSSVFVFFFLFSKTNLSPLSFFVAS